MKERETQHTAEIQKNQSRWQMLSRIKNRRLKSSIQTTEHHCEGSHDHVHHDHTEHEEEKPLVSRKWQIGTVAGNAVIGAAELATGQLSTLSVAADGAHNFGDAFTYYTQTESVLNKEQSQDRKKKLRKLGYYILFGTSAAIAAKTAYDLSTEQEHTQNPLTLYAASASLALNSVLASTLYRSYKKRNTEGIQDEHEHDIVKHLMTDSASAALAFGGAVAQKYGISDLEPYAALGGAAITGWAFRPTRKNLEHSHNHFSDDNAHDHGHGHGHGHQESHAASDKWKQAVTPTAARIAFAAVSSGAFTQEQKHLGRKQKAAFAAASSDSLHQYLHTANQISLESRRRSYAGDNKSFEERNREWNKMYTYQLKELTGEHIDKHLRDERIKAIASLDIDVFDDSKDASGTLSLQVEQFRQKYVGGHGSNIGQFVKDISKGCKNDDGSIDLHMLESRLASIEPMLNAFGTEYDMHLLVKDFAIAHGMLSYSGKKGKEIAVYAARQIKKSASLEQEERLRALQIMHAIQRSEGHYIYSGISRLERFANDHNRKLILAS